MNSVELTELVARIGNAYTRQRLSPPSRLHEAAKRWRGLSADEIVEIVESHFDRWHSLYTSGASDRHFHMIESAVRRAMDAKYGVCSGEEDAVQTRPKRRGAVTKLYNGAGGFDAFDDSDESEVDVSRLNAPQPPIDRQPERVEYLGLDGDDDPEDA